MSPVRVLQATDGVRIHICEPDVLDQPHQRRVRHRLHAVEQRSDGALLLVLVLQSRPRSQPRKRMEEGRCGLGGDPRGPHRRLRHGLLRFPGCQDAGAVPEIQARLLLRNQTWVAAGIDEGENKER